MSARLTCVVLLTATLVAPAAATPYWIAWEGEDYPENEGWERHYGNEDGPWQGGAERSIENGIMTIDSMRNHMIYDYYRIDRQLNPDPGELFIAEWSVRILHSLGPVPDATLGIARDGEGTLAFGFRVDSVTSLREGWAYPLSPDVLHAFRLESTDLLSYSLFIDGVYLRDGLWDLESLNESFFAFGDGSYGGTVRSYSEWDYVRFGVIPEPETALMVSAVILIVFRSHRRQP